VPNSRPGLRSLAQDRLFTGGSQQSNRLIGVTIFSFSNKLSAAGFDDFRFEFLAVGAFNVHPVLFETHGDWIAGGKFSGVITIGRGKRIFADVIDPVYLHNHSASALRALGDLTLNFPFGLHPVFDVTPRNSAARFVNLLRAPPYGLM
jgi:hypothetical protein